MRVDDVPRALSQQLGPEATDGLLGVLDRARRETTEDVMRRSAESFGRRLTEEISGLRIEFREGLARHYADFREALATQRAELREVIAAQGAGLRGEIAAQRAEFHQTIATQGSELRTEMAAQASELRQAIATQGSQWPCRTRTSAKPSRRRARP